jgi:hypothetical protein
MDRIGKIIRRVKLVSFVVVSLGLGLRMSEAQTQPSAMPEDLLSPMVSYEEGIANILSQDAARPKAVQLSCRALLARPIRSLILQQRTRPRRSKALRRRSKIT